MPDFDKKLENFGVMVESRYPHISQLLYNTPLMISPEKADVIHHVIQGYAIGQPPSVDAGAFDSNDERRPYQVTTRGVAVIPVHGALVHRVSGLDALSGLTSYQRLSRMLATAEADEDVRGVLLDVDSPGGSVSGLFELAKMIARIGESKPVWSAINENMFSAAYAIGAATSRATAPESAMAGSIGVIMMHLDRSSADKKAGRKYTPIFAGGHKTDGSPHAPLSNQAMQTFQGIVDATYDLFVEHVAAGRGMDAQAVRDTEAQIYMAKDALDVGLIDGIASFDETILMLESEVNRSTAINLQASACNTTESIMTDKTKAEAETTAPQEQLYAARAEGHADGVVEGQMDERERVDGILGHAKAPVNFAQAANAIKTGLSLEQATGVLDAMPDPESLGATHGAAFAAAMEGTNPDIAADGAHEDGDSDDAVAARIVNLVQPTKQARGR